MGCAMAQAVIMEARFLDRDSECGFVVDKLALG
jgi:hypothetical protein